MAQVLWMRLEARGSRLAARGSRLRACGSRLEARGSGYMDEARGSRLATAQALAAQVTNVHICLY